MNVFLQDLRHGIRVLAGSPGFAFAAVLTLALGIGANTALYSVVYALLLRPLPFADAARLMLLRETYPQVGQVSVPYPDFLDWRQRNRTFSQMVAVRGMGFNLGGIENPERVRGYAVSPEFLRTVGLQPKLGRDFLPQEEKPGTDPVAMISHALWQSRFAGDPRVPGSHITLDGRSFTIIAVLPEGLALDDKADVVAPIGVWADSLMSRGDHSDLAVMARLRSGVSVERARREMARIAEGLAVEYPATNRMEGISLLPVREALVGDARPALMVLWAAVMFVLLIACVNVANLAMVRGSARKREFAMRRALGAAGARLIRQVFTENLLLAGVGAVLGLGLAYWGIRALSQWMPGEVMRMTEIRLDPAVVAFTLALAVLTAAAAGLPPALQAARGDVQQGLESGREASPGAGTNRLRAGLAAAEIALALVLLAGAGLMMQSLYRLLHVDPGFRPEGTVTMEVQLAGARYAGDAAARGFWELVLAKVRAMPGIEAAAAAMGVPLSGNFSRTDITIEGMPTPAAGEFPHPDFHVVTPGYTEALGIPLLRGRTLKASDNATAPEAAMVNATLARRFWGSEEAAIGKRFLLGHPAPGRPWRTIAGVVGDVKLYGLGAPARLEIYVPLAQVVARDMNLVVRSRGGPAAAIAAVRTAIRSVDADQPVFAVAEMNRLVEDSAPIRRMMFVLLGLFSALAVALAAIGIYGVVSFSAAQRTQEIGIRMAIGARPENVLWMVLSGGLRMAGAGVLLGLGAAALATRSLSSLLFGLTATDPATFAAVAVLLLAVALAACLIPARRAMRIDPIAALRHE